MLHGAYAGVFFGKYSASGGIYDILGKGINQRFVFKVYTLKLDSVVVGSGIESRRNLKA